MKIPMEAHTVFLEKFGINVNKYLTYAQIQTIVNSTETLMNEKNDKGQYTNTWADRQTNIDMMLLMIATDIPQKDLSEIKHSTFLSSGLLDAVKANIINLSDLDLAFKYTESWDKLLSSNLNNIVAMLKKIKDVPNIKEQFNGK